MCWLFLRGSAIIATSKDGFDLHEIPYDAGLYRPRAANGPFSVGKVLPAAASEPLFDPFEQLKA
jgi:hypothetical protein